MLWFIITTWRCNLSCKYCGNEPNPYGEPSDIAYSLDTLRKFLSNDREPIVAFYGGEPLLRKDVVEWIIRYVPAEHFVLQTNGLLMKRLGPEYLARMDTILISIDGRREITDYYRGSGVYARAIAAAKYLREISYRGDLIARMTISGRSDIFLDVKHLVDLGLFDHIHWQLDVFFDAPPRR